MQIYCIVWAFTHCLCRKFITQYIFFFSNHPVALEDIWLFTLYTNMHCYNCFPPYGTWFCLCLHYRTPWTEAPFRYCRSWNKKANWIKIKIETPFTLSKLQLNVKYFNLSFADDLQTCHLWWQNWMQSAFSCFILLVASVLIVCNFFFDFWESVTFVFT